VAGCHPSGSGDPCGLSHALRAAVPSGSGRPSHGRAAYASARPRMHHSVVLNVSETYAFVVFAAAPPLPAATPAPTSHRRTAEAHLGHFMAPRSGAKRTRKGANCALCRHERFVSPPFCLVLACRHGDRQRRRANRACPAVSAFGRVPRRYDRRERIQVTWAGCPVLHLAIAQVDTREQQAEESRSRGRGR